jgi:Zn-dependent M28 family amino/carboxypeptidase
MKKIHLFFLIILSISFTSNAQKKGLASINQSDLKSYMTFFASDEMMGRETGTPQNDAAALYLKTNLMRLGLKPASGADDYFQKIPLVRTRTDKKNTFLKINNNQGENVFSTDSIITLIRPSSSLEFTGKLVFAGYGFTDKDKGYNDLSGIDLKDKIVLVMTGKPESEISDRSEFFDENVEGLKIMSIIGGGAKAVLLVYDPTSKFNDAYESGLANMVSSDAVTFKDKKEFSLPAQILFITRNAADALLKTTSSSLKQMQEKIISTGKPASAEVQDITVAISTSIEKSEFSGSNVIGIIEGSDPVLKNESVIYTAHFDHTGIGANGEINNGADDDASGSMALLEVAEAFTRLKKKPLRTIVLAWMNGEEKGLLGSEYYADHPLIPLENTLSDINLDMVGRSKMAADTGKLYGFEMNVTQPRELIVYTAHESSELLDIMYASAKESGLTIKDMGRDIPAGSSDHVPFREKGIPALCFHSGIHADLHGPGDDVNKIDFDKMERSSKLAFLIGYKLANQRERIAIDNPDKQGIIKK